MWEYTTHKSARNGRRLSSFGVLVVEHLPPLIVRLARQMCEAHCREQGADLFAVEWRIQCFCGDSSTANLQKHASKKRDAECSFSCGGDDSLTCGGCECGKGDRRMLGLGFFAAPPLALAYVSLG